MRYQFRDVEVDPVRRTISRRGRLEPLPSRAFDVLLHLLENRERTVSREELLDAIWPDVIVEDGSLTQNVSVLRRAIGDRSADPPSILTVPGQGYRFTASVEVVEADASDSVPGQGLRWRLAGSALAILILVVSFAANARREPASALDADGTSIAVLPFRAGSYHSPADERTIRLSDAVIARLGTEHRDLTVRSSSAVFEFADPSRDTAAEAGNELDVSMVLVGFVAGQPAETEAELQLVDVRRNAVVWSGRWTGSIASEGDRQGFATKVAGDVAAAIRAAN